MMIKEIMAMVNNRKVTGYSGNLIKVVIFVFVLFSS